MEREEVSTVFKVADESTGPLRQMTQAADKLTTSTERAKKATEHVGAGGVHEYREGATAEERERFKLDREEMRARRSRSRALRLEEQRGNLIERATEIASKGVISSQKGAVGAIAGLSSSAEALGYNMAAFGGTMGKVGMGLVKFGGPIAAATAAFEVGAFVLEKTGLGEKLSNWAQHIVGITHTQKDLEEAEALQAKYLGYKSVADYKSAEATEKRWKQEEAMAWFIQRNLQTMEAKPSSDNAAAMAEWRESFFKSSRDIAAATGKPLEQVMAELEKAAEHTSASSVARANREAELAKIEENAMLNMKAVPIAATIEETKAHNEEIRSTVAQLVKSRQIRMEEAEAVANSLLAHTDEAGSIQALIAKRMETEEAEGKVAFFAEQYARFLPKIPVHQTIESMHKFNEAFAEVTTQAVQALGLDTPEKLKGFQTELLAKAKHTTHNDFRNSRFDIKQAFAEGFDPDRIAIAFSNDLASLGERRLTSGLSPLYAAR